MREPSGFESLEILVDNAAAEGLAAEHGLSIRIKAGGKTFLLDAGQGGALEKNAAALGVDLAGIDGFVLSHGHYDHSGATGFVLSANPEIELYAHPEIFSRRYSIYPDRETKDISMPAGERRAAAGLQDSHLHWIREPSAIAPGVWLTGPIPRVHPLEDTGGPFFTDPAGREPDLIEDDMAMWIETPKGLLVVCGCCHSGLINTLNLIAEMSGNRPILGIIGGLHLKSASEERLAVTVEALRRFSPDFMVPCHCTGAGAIDYFRDHLDFKIVTGYAGFELTAEKEL